MSIPKFFLVSFLLSFSLSCFCCFFACSSKMSNKRTILTRHAHWALQEQLQQQHRRRGVLRLRRHTRYQCWHEHNGLVEQVACPILNLHFPLEEHRFPPFNGDGHGGGGTHIQRENFFILESESRSSIWQNVTGKLETRFWNSKTRVEAGEW